MNAPPTLARAAVAAALSLLAACSFAPPPSVPEPVAALPRDFRGAAGPGDVRSREWWKAFRDPVLDAVVDSALAANFDLAAAVARVRQARAQAGIARAALRPIVQASASVAESDNPSNAGFGRQFREISGDLIPAGTLPRRLGIETVALGVDFAYELDFWGRARNASLAAGHEYLASESDFRAARIGVLSETIATYFEIVDLRRRTGLAGEIAAVLSEREALTETRYDRGLATSLDLQRVRQELRNVQASVPQLESALVAAEGRLAVLVGGFREKLDAVLADSLAPLPPSDVVATGVPADLLVQRPDVHAAGLRLEAARLAIGAERARALPSLSFSGTIGLQAAEAGELFDPGQWFRNLIGNVTTPIFGRDRIRADVAVAEARFSQAAAAYGRTVTTAVHEVEAALAALAAEGRRHEFLASQRDEAAATVQARSRRYAAGVGGYVDYLDAVRGLLGVESTLAAARRDLALTRLALHRALGGDWTAPPDEGDGGRAVPAADGHDGPNAAPNPAPTGSSRVRCRRSRRTRGSSSA